MATFDGHLKCVCRDKGACNDLCYEETLYYLQVTAEQKQQLAIPTYKVQK